MRLFLAILLLSAACGDDDSPNMDSGFDAARLDATMDSGFDATGDATVADAPVDAPSVDSNVDAPADDAAIEPEDCATTLDEDANGLAGCADPVCWSEVDCIADELEDNELGSWTACGDPIELDVAMTTAFCEAGTPFPTEREFQCGRVPTTIRLETYCEPEGTGRALRYRVSMDLSADDMMLGPMTGRHTSFSPELGYLGTLYTARGGSGSSSEDPTPTVDAWEQASAWVVAQTGTHVIVLLGASSQTTTFTIHDDGSVTAVNDDPQFFLTAGLDTIL